jgi:RNA polymerase sigma-70 factor (ECF subfamily)
VSEQAFEQLIRNHYEGLYRFALSLTQNEADAGELVQDTYHAWAEQGRAARNARRHRVDLFADLYRRFLGHRRRASQLAPYEAGPETESLPSLPPVSLEGLDGPAVLAALGQVVEEFREPLTLFYLQEHSCAEIAEILDLPVATVMQRIAQGKAALRKALAARRTRLAGKPAAPAGGSNFPRSHE